jgi:hypothetical protein
MASKIKVDQIEGSTASTITLPSGQTLDLSSGSLTLPDGAVDLATSKVTGTIPVSKGGTGITSLGTANQILQVNSGATALEFGTAPSGKLKQFVSISDNTKYAQNTGTTPTAVQGTNVDLAITPSSASSRILVCSNLQYIVTKHLILVMV